MKTITKYHISGGTRWTLPKPINYVFEINGKLKDDKGNTVAVRDGKVFRTSYDHAMGNNRYLEIGE